MDIKDLRKEIDEIDREIVPLLEKRFLVIDAVKRYKKKNNISIQDSNREQEILSNIRPSKKEFKKYLDEIYKSILKESKDYQNE